MRRTDAPAATVKAVRDRDQWRCARCAGWGPLTTQHRRARGMGGSRWPGINLPANLLTLCGSGTTQCHGLVESRPVWAGAHGWSVRQHQDPAEVPVWTWDGWVLIDNTGAWVRLEDYPGVDGCLCGCASVPLAAGLWENPAHI